jgi:hypothetical protein
MVYGVDQCRVCGVPIVPKGPDQAIQQEKANRRPTMPEKEWRRLGLLTVPTRHQLTTDPAGGCCAKCGLLMTRRKYHYNYIAAAMVLAGVGIFAFILIVVTFLPH